MLILIDYSSLANILTPSPLTHSHFTPPPHTSPSPHTHTHSHSLTDLASPEAHAVFQPLPPSPPQSCDPVETPPPSGWDLLSQDQHWVGSVPDTTEYVSHDTGLTIIAIS